MNKFLTFILLSLTLFTSACDLGSSKHRFIPQDTVIVDLEAVARALGKDEVMKQQAEENNKKLAVQLKTYADNLKAQIEEEKSKINKKKITEEEKKRFQQLTTQASQELQKSQTKARQQAQTFQAQLIQAFRDEISVVAQKVAVQRGAKVVLSASHNVLWFNPESDITDEVIAAMRGAENNISTPSTEAN